MATTHTMKYAQKKLQLTPPQIRALADIADTLSHSDRVTIIQTKTDTGGRHVYAEKPNGAQFHVATNGNAQRVYER